MKIKALLAVLTWIALRGAASAQNFVPSHMPDFDGAQGLRQSLEKQWMNNLFKSSRTTNRLSQPPVHDPRQNFAPVMVIAAPDARAIDSNDFYDALARRDIVYVGEQHTVPAHHALQLEVLKQLHARRPRLVLGLEMIDVTRQQTLNDYLDGKMPESEFRIFWEKAWGFNADLYLPILRYAKDERIPVRALNLPRSIASQIWRGGLASLSPEQRRLLPETISPTDDPRYLEYMKKAAAEHGDLDPGQLTRLLEAQTAWNEMMGASAIQASREGLVVVIAGSGHMVYDAGIPESVRRRAALRQAVVLPYPMDGEQVPLDELLGALRKPGSQDIQLGDYFALLPGKP